MSGLREKTWGKLKKFREGQKEQTLDDLSFVFIETVNKCKDCKLSCVGNYALDASGLWRLQWPAIKSLMEIAIT